jgi:hypothetical protein
MGEFTILDKAFHYIMARMVETGQARFYAELAQPLGLSIAEGKKTLTPFSPPGYRDGCTREPISSLPLRPSTIFPPNTVLP